MDTFIGRLHSPVVLGVQRCSPLEVDQRRAHRTTERLLRPSRVVEAFPNGCWDPRGLLKAFPERLLRPTGAAESVPERLRTLVTARK